MKKIEYGKLYQRTNGTIGDQITIALYPHNEKQMDKNMIVVLVLNERYEDMLEIHTVLEQDFTHYDEDYVHYQTANSKTYYLKKMMTLLFDNKFEDEKGLLK